MIGLAIGDSFGDTCRKPEQQLAYGFTTDFGKGASWSTDDTEFAIMTASIIVDCGGEPTAEAVCDAWLKNVVTQDELKRGGASEFEAARNLKKGLRAPLSGRYNSYCHSDGAAMRIAPVGVLCACDIDRAVRAAYTDASISHDREGIWGAQSVAAAVAAAMGDADFHEIFQAAMKPVPADTWYEYAMKKAFSIVDDNGCDILRAWMPLHDELWTSYKASACEAVPQAFACLRLCHNDFRSGMTLAGNFGRDADTIGAICGAILGAKYGYDSIPNEWAEKSRYPSGTCLPFAGGIDIIALADKITDIIMENANGGV
ncbi:MAG: ADP-ribosylglycohydrolase family protein [Bacillota bacterium]